MISTLKTARALMFGLLSGFVLAPCAIAGGQLVNRSVDALALDGFDPVAYFTEGRPAPGMPSIEYSWNGTRYRFATAANRELFQKSPESYVPQYGGFCAWAVSRGYTAPVDPEAWAVVHGKLYLNYSKRVQRMWQEDVPGNIRKADANWPTLRSKLAGR
ncbi:MAG TPA: YHS domain-containing (seleno)protein [Vicinamibacterales bacterium]|nr:YHS domain-containing (seleno)protein [Vicinamibacterales bacterium]